MPVAIGVNMTCMLVLQTLTACVATTDAERATSFYGETLGLPLIDDDGFALVFRTAQALLRIQKLPQHAPLAHTALGWQVNDVAAAVATLTERGVRFERYAGMAQDESGVWRSPAGAKVAWFKDPDGNILSLSEGGLKPTPSDNVVPEIFVHDGQRALAFYQEAFGASVRSRLLTADGRLQHGELELGGHRLFVLDEFPELGTCRCPRTLGGTAVRITLEVDDADAVVARASAAGATVLLPVATMFWGARYAKLRDPFGHEWGINEQRERLTPEQVAANADGRAADPAD